MTESDPSNRFFALIPCAGSGSRAGTAQPKQYQPIAGTPMVLHTLAALAGVSRLAEVLVVVAPGDAELNADALGVQVVPCGGATRAASVRNGLDSLLAQGARGDDWVLVHDAARCLVTPPQIDALIDRCQHDAVGGLLAHRLADTLKTASDDRAVATLARDGKWLAQTPQMFRIGALAAALDAAGDQVTDESSAMEAQGHRPLLVEGGSQNFKVTWPDDFALAEAILKNRNGEQHMNIRLGEGWDVHALVAGRKLVIGGVTIPFDKGLLGHSDADVLLHAITDALLGAAALGDIGRHFPDTDPQFAGADSAVLLAEAARCVRAAGFAIGNIDSTVIAQAPKLAPHIAAMREAIAAALEVAVGQVNVKAKTAEKLGPVGEGLSIEARASVLLFAIK
jgi:2-C-methyl-D-erythritol 4-phosphate cytidylyltransferase / 2-C-methyl-D-erythritol 2,4-cyclodiphosphate synthase